MSNTGRIALVAAVAVVAVALFVIVSPGGDDNSNKTASGGKAKAPGGERIVIGGGKPEGGIHRISATKGDRIKLTVTSSDTKSEVHVHGYNILKDMAPGKSVTFDFPAKIEGVFEVELEATKTQIAKLSVRP
jgi:FtsP/CotA-like multicopper oxidase with cupredoxin domain